MRRGRPRPARLDPIPDAYVPPNWGITPAILACSRQVAPLSTLGAGLGALANKHPLRRQHRLNAAMAVARVIVGGVFTERIAEIISAFSGGARWR
jgi:hypothetical protein